MKNFVMLFGALALLTTGCMTLEMDADGNTVEKERWNRANEPTRFTGVTLKTKLDELPMTGRAEQEIWPSSYWPTHKDSINHRWYNNEFSPAEKYDQAFNGWVPAEGFSELKPYKGGRGCAEFDAGYYESLGPLANHISRYMGNGRARDGVDSDDDGEIDECGDRDGVETWFGLCHAWVPASMLEQRPRYPVIYNGVKFHTGDIEALIITVYNRVGADMIGGRCNDKEIERDEQGRAIDSDCRDTNAGTLHLIMTNYLGLNQLAFAEDRTFNYEVWNQPVVEYNIHQQEEITLEQAIEAVSLEGETYDHNPDAVFFYRVNASLVYITESDASTTPAEMSRYERTERYTYILELDADRNIIGGEWTGNSRSLHPDFLWNPRRAERSSVPHLDLDNVRELIRLSQTEGSVFPAESLPAETIPESGTDTDSSDPQTFSVEPGMEIPDNDREGVTVELVVPEGVTGTVTVEFKIAHTYAKDISVGLLSPSGERWTLVEQDSAQGDDVERSIELSPAPTGELGGTWRLVVADNLNLDTGTVERFALIVQP